MYVTWLIPKEHLERIINVYLSFISRMEQIMISVYLLHGTYFHIFHISRRSQSPLLALNESLNPSDLDTQVSGPLQVTHTKLSYKLH